MFSAGLLSEEVPSNCFAKNVTPNANLEKDSDAWMIFSSRTMKLEVQALSNFRAKTMENGDSPTVLTETG